MLWSNIIFELY